MVNTMSKQTNSTTAPTSIDSDSSRKTRKKYKQRVSLPDSLQKELAQVLEKSGGIASFITTNDTGQRFHKLLQNNIHIYGTGDSALRKRVRDLVSVWKKWHNLKTYDKQVLQKFQVQSFAAQQEKSSPAEIRESLPFTEGDATTAATVLPVAAGEYCQSYKPLTHEEKVQRYDAEIEDLQKLKEEAEKDLTEACKINYDASKEEEEDVDMVNAKARVEEYKKQLNHRRDYRKRLKRQVEAAASEATAVVLPAPAVKRQKHSAHEEDNRTKLKRQVEAGEPEAAADLKRQAVVRVLIFTKRTSTSSGSNNGKEVKQVLLVPSDIGDGNTVHDAMVVAQQRKEFLFMDDGSGDIEFWYNYNDIDLPLHYRTDSKETVLRDLFSLVQEGKPLELWYKYTAGLEENTVLDLSVRSVQKGVARQL